MATPVFTWENVHTLAVVSHAVVVVVMTKLEAVLPTNAPTVPVRPVPPVHAMIGTPPGLATKKPDGKLMVMAFDEIGAPVGSVKVTVTAPVPDAYAWLGVVAVIVQVDRVTWPPRRPEAKAVLGLSRTVDTVTDVAPAVGTPVFTWENVHTLAVVSHAVVVVVMTKLVAVLPTNAPTVPVRPVPPEHDMIGTPPGLATKKPDGKLMVMAFDEIGAPLGSVKVTVTAPVPDAYAVLGVVAVIVQVDKVTWPPRAPAEVGGLC